ncbi:MAG: molybdopterin-dependent oxidoreductase [Arenicellales bacterium]|jgi:hypothetical protein|nr:molybdopterin-dependent oxidoreductase [Arenicellales bacterium]MDP6947440.1 molybdopterin-dependent oxidoreductase [Arenicellales bacterium]
MDTITVYHGDSATTPLAGMCTATRGVYMSGNAVRLAAEAVQIHDLPITPEKVVKVLQQKLAADHQPGPSHRDDT